MKLKGIAISVTQFSERHLVDWEDVHELETDSYVS